MIHQIALLELHGNEYVTDERQGKDQNVTRQLTGDRESAAIARLLADLIIEANLPHAVCAAAIAVNEPIGDGQ